MVTIVGASVRAAAASAVRAGYQVRAGDLFADVDLRSLSTVTRVEEYPGGLEAIVRAGHDGAWMYTGALENHPALVGRTARARPLLGNAADVLASVRDPGLVARVLKTAGLPCPDVARNVEQVPANGTWLRKPLRSAGGARVGVWRGADQGAKSSIDEYYYQEYINGLACSAVYVAADGTATLLGVSRQLIGDAWTGARDFQYCGSIGPIELPAPNVECFQQIGSVLADRCQLVGVFGVDAVVNDQGVWPLEINPRFTASAELFDWAHDVSTVGMHIAACESGSLPPTPRSLPGGLFGKAIVFATCPVVVGNELGRLAEGRLSHNWPALADVPAPGTRVPSGHPIVTVFAAAPDERLVLRNLHRAVAGVRATLSPDREAGLLIQRG